MQFLEGDVIRTSSTTSSTSATSIRPGNPGRHELDETQELYYPAIMAAIADTAYDGYVGQEFSPVKDAKTSLEAAYRICDV